MPRFYPSIPFDACYGSVGNRTYYHWKGVPYYKKKAFTDFPGTPAQLEQAAVHSRALAAWRSIPHETQLVWNELARPVRDWAGGGCEDPGGRKVEEVCEGVWGEVVT